VDSHSFTIGTWIAYCKRRRRRGLWKKFNDLRMITLCDPVDHVR